MANPYIGEIRMVGFNFAPVGWALCNGQVLSIPQNTALFSIIGTYFGGNGTTNFGLPNLQASAPIGTGNGNGLTPRILGETGGEPAVTLLQTQMPVHAHGAACRSGGGTTGSPAGAFWADDGSGRGISLYATTAGTNPAMNQAALKLTGNSLPHNNMPPYLSIYFIIALQGIYPPRN
jgi:microcystin-dependent protein